ncbi:phosphoribosyltransferase [Clostridium baratii]|uniref:phosphoribosyltransferase n=1 Tax=Clostridium baratii TaxID=1561 RepID=UPI0006BAF5B7|nr:phosphoribosyltransferase [Clostridium baratii]
MEKILVISKEVYIDYDNYDINGEFKNFINTMLAQGNAVVFTSGRADDVENMKIYFNDLGYSEEKNFYIKSRDEIKAIIKNNIKEYFIIIGNRDRDFETAVNNKLLYVVPNWCNEIYDKSKKYGVNIDSIEELKEIIKTVNNQNTWYYNEKLEDGTEIYSLISGMYKKWDVPPKEKELVIGFENYLKRGKRDYYEILYYHFLAGISNLPKFKEIDIWAITPSSGRSLNKDMMDFKDKARYMMKKRYTKEGDNLFLRHTPIKKSHTLPEYIRLREGAKMHFDSIYLNPAYNVKGKNICIFDDYLTHGNTFEAMRNILKKAGAKKIIFVSLGRFKKDYFVQNYDITGDVTIPNGFKYVLKRKYKIPYRCNDKARKEVENLHDIFNLE